MSKAFLYNFIRAGRDLHASKAESVLQELSAQICTLMAEKKMSWSELAERLGTSSAYITKILDGVPDVTVETLVRISRALGSELRIDLVSTADE